MTKSCGWNGVAQRLFLCASLIVLSAVGGMASVTAQEASEGDDFAQWVAAFKAEAIERGISQTTLDAAFANLEINPRVIALDRAQPEFTQTFQEYLSRRVSAARVERGLGMMAEHRETLRAVAAQYGVQPRFIAAIWGMETNFGSYTGGMNVIQSLATLAYDPRRSAFFRDQLFYAFQIVEEGHVTLENMVGSWGGAMGHPQFMPKSFFDFAQDFNGDGRRDIWGTEADVFASIAYYLSRSGWRSDVTWGRQVILPANFADFEARIEPSETVRGCRAKRSHSLALPLSDWQEMGVRRLNGDSLPSVEVSAKLLRPAGDNGPAYLIYANFDGILAYNCANYYGLAVSALSDALKLGE